MIDGYREGYRRGFSAVRDAVRDMRRDHPREWLSFKLVPVRTLLMVGAIRACTHASGAASFAALVSATLAWAAVEIGIEWAVKKPGVDAPGEYGAVCEPITATEPKWLTLCDLDPRGDLCVQEGEDDALQILVGRCTKECRAPRVPCEAVVILKIGARELGRGRWDILRATEAAQEFLEYGGPVAETMMRQVDRNLGVRIQKQQNR